MGPREFALAVRQERDAILKTFTNPKADSAVGEHLAAASLTPAQRREVLAAMNVAVFDALYTLLLALDVAASLGGRQHSFGLTDESGDVIANGDGGLEAAAWNAFHGDGS